MRDFLLVANQYAVRGIPLNVSQQEDVILPLTGLAVTFSASAVEYDASEETVFYNDCSRNLIYKGAVNGTRESSHIDRGSTLQYIDQIPSVRLI